MAERDMTQKMEGTVHLQQRYHASFSVIKDLVKHLVADLPTEDHDRLLRHSAKAVLAPGAWASSSSTLADEDEAVLVHKIEQQLKALHKPEAISRFNSLYRLLRRPEKSSLIQNRQGLFNFLLKLSEKIPREPNGEPVSAQSTSLGFLSQEDLKSKIFRNVPSSMQKGIINQSMPVSLSSSGVHRSASAEFPSQSQSKRPTSLKTGNLRHSTLLEEKPSSSAKSKDRPSSSESLSLLATTPSRPVAKGVVPESKVVKELLFCFQGIQGSLFKLDHQQGFTIDPMVKVPHEGLVVKLIELGYLHNRITSQCRQLEKGGAVAQAIYCAVKKIMTEYYATIGCFDSELQQSSAQSNSAQSNTPDTPMSEVPVDPLGLGIFRLSILCREPLRTLKFVADVIKFALSGKGGGAAFSAIEILRHHGDTRYSQIAHKIVDQAGKPLVHMIIVWMVHGTLFDHHDEFFIAVNSSCHDRDIWRDKFVLRSNLIPSVLSNTQAEMILRAGKGIHFLNVIREVRLPVEGLRKKLHRMKTCNIIDFADPRSQMCEMLCGVVEETSKLVLDVLVNEFKLFQHFQGLRRYILLGQGDFASYFLELMEPEMNKEASRLQYHELMSLLGTAIRGSTAAHDDPEILKRVTVKVLEASGGDWGSDVFSLQYIMHEPLNAAFKVSGGAYTLMFNFLWRTKRMEHVLLLLRKQRWEIKNQLSWVGHRVPEVNGVLMFADLMAQEFLHFARQFHYYILFEVVECSWDKFCQDFKKARSFDDVIRAHEEFISEMQKRTFQKTDNPRERTFINELRSIWNLVFEVETLQHRFFNRMMKEWDFLKNREAALDSGAGTSYPQEEEYQNKRKEFKCFLSSIKAQYNIIHRNYQDFIKKFLLDLSVQKDHELRLLSSRIDYNEHYKRIDSRLNESMKFSRCSDLMFY